MRKALHLLYVAVMTASGAIFGVSCLGDFILGVQYGYDHGFGESAKSALLGGVIGATIGWLISVRRRKPPISD